MGDDVYRVDPEDPRAPPQEVWDRLTPEERARIADSLPSEFPASESQPPEGDAHFEAKIRAREMLGSFFSRMGRKLYLGCELPVYYPGETMFAPDVIAVMDVEPHARMRWLVSTEGRGLDLALEIHVAGDRRKDLERNVERFARLGIREYFLFDRGRLKLSGWRLSGEGRRIYQPIVPQQGFYLSEVLGLELQLEGERLRFYCGRAPLPESEELIATLERMVGEAEAHRSEEARMRVELEQQLVHEQLLRKEETRRREEETRRREEETRRREEETRRREEAEQKLAEALAEVKRLRDRAR